MLTAQISLARGGLACGLALLAACSSGLVTAAGPFGNGGVASEQCVPVSPGGAITYGFEEFHNNGGTARIEKVSLASPSNLRVLATWAVQITGHDLYGIWGGYPSASDLSPGVQWAQRQHADGAVIPHSRSINNVTNLVLVLKPVGTKGTASGLNVLYKANGTEYEMHMPTHILLTVSKSC